MTPDQDLDGLAAPVRERFRRRHAGRETAYAASRDAVRAAANAIRALHRGDTGPADDLLARARAELDRATTAAADHPEVLYGGFVQDAAKEVAEARITRAALAGDPLPGPDETDVDDASWLHGLAETVGELRRAALDHVRAGRLADAERLLTLMDDILAVLVSIDVPEALTRGLRRAADAARAITERTRGDLTGARGRRELQDALGAHRRILERLLDGEEQAEEPHEPA